MARQELGIQCASWRRSAIFHDRATLREQIAAGVFPVRLKPADWMSGDKIWLLDVIAPTRQLASAMLANLRQVLPSNELSVHPVAAAQVDPELIKAMRAGSKNEVVA